MKNGMDRALAQIAEDRQLVEYVNECRQYHVKIVSASAALAETNGKTFWTAGKWVFVGAMGEYIGSRMYQQCTDATIKRIMNAI